MPKRKVFHDGWKTQRHLNRYTEIVRVLVKHGFGELIDQSHIRNLLSPSKRTPTHADIERNLGHTKWARIRMVLEDLGITFVKFGQIMSNRPDLLPEELIKELEKLQTEVPPFPTDEALAIVENELGRPLSEVFRSFDQEPMASASIAQVYGAELRTGERVAVKVQRPDLEAIISTDIEIMHFFASGMEMLFLRSNTLSVSSIIAEFGKSLRKEIDFVAEASNLRKFAHQFRNNPMLKVPAVHAELSTKRVLVMERIDGIKVSNVRALLTAGLDPKKVAHEGAHVVISQIFEHGFFHADPHPGNILVLEGNRICFLDFGMMGLLLPRHREILSNMMVGLVERDERRVTRGILDLSVSRTVENVEALEHEVYEIIDYYTDRPLKSVDAGDLLSRLLRIVVAFNVRMPPGFFLLAKALISIEGVARRLDPEFDMFTHMEPIVRRMFLKSFSPETVAKDLYISALQLSSLLRGLPKDAREIIDRLKSGRVVHQFDPADLKPILRKTDQISNRISSSLILSSLIVGSSIVINARIPPMWNGISLIGIAGFLGAGLMGFWLLITILRNRP